MAEHASHPMFARIYARVAEISERRGGAEHRRKLLTGLQGRVVEVGAGSGANFRHYPTSVSEVVAVEPEPYLRERAERAASGVPSRSLSHTVAPIAFPGRRNPSMPVLWHSCSARCPISSRRSRSSTA
jgi:hypothetical protein